MFYQFYICKCELCFSAIFRLAKPAFFSGTIMEKVRVEHKTGLAKCGTWEKKDSYSGMRDQNPATGLGHAPFRRRDTGYYIRP